MVPPRMALAPPALVHAAAVPAALPPLDAAIASGATDGVRMGEAGGNEILSGTRAFVRESAPPRAAMTTPERKPPAPGARAWSMRKTQILLPHKVRARSCPC